MWIYKDAELESIPEETDVIGFVYLITNTINGRRYIGKKQFYSFTTGIKTVTLKDGTKKKKKKKITKESDWKDYYSSSPELLKDVEQFGKENFKREILDLCYNKGTMSYLEARYQMDFRVLESTDWYNGQIQCRIHKSHVKLK